MSFVFQVQDKLKTLLGERERLKANWESKQKWLENTYQEQVFYRDIEHMKKLTNSQEVGTSRFFVVWAFSIINELSEVLGKRVLWLWRHLWRKWTLLGFNICKFCSCYKMKHAADTLQISFYSMFKMIHGYPAIHLSVWIASELPKRYHFILQVQLKNSDLGSTVDETDTLIKRHEAFEKLISTQEDKVSTIFLFTVFHLYNWLIIAV